MVSEKKKKLDERRELATGWARSQACAWPGYAQGASQTRQTEVAGILHASREGEAETDH
jgi:hypothetical protein